MAQSKRHRCFNWSILRVDDLPIEDGTPTDSAVHFQDKRALFSIHMGKEILEKYGDETQGRPLLTTSNRPSRNDFQTYEYILLDSLLQADSDTFCDFRSERCLVLIPKKIHFCKLYKMYARAVRILS